MAPLEIRPDRERRYTRRRAILFAALAATSLLPVSCSSAKDTPEAQVRALIARAETAAEQKDLAALRSMISDKYADSEGQDKKAIEAVLRFYFLRNQSIHLFTRIQAITFPEPSRARAVALVAMAGRPIKGEQELERLHADLNRFVVTLARENTEWRVVTAEWRRAEAGDFL
ncbi:MAG TPA: hypothetical protein VEI74_03345 [Candidatus Methylomirabilis sp.]|nr:hypothetical protein [Candidatus Methylomirabilis sp.]